MKVNSVPNHNVQQSKSVNFNGMRQLVAAEVIKNLSELITLDLTKGNVVDAFESLNKTKKMNFPEVTKNILSENAAKFSDIKGRVNINGMIENLENIFQPEHFLNVTKKIGDVTLLKRQIANNRISYEPTNVSLVKTEIVNPRTKEKNLIFSFFEKGYESKQNVGDIDKSELGLMEMRAFDADNLAMPSVYNKSRANSSIRALKRAYEGDKSNAMEVLHLLSYEGDKYKGIGTKLLDTAVQYSKDAGYGGRICLDASNSHPLRYYKDSSYCEIRKKQTPTPFYYKYGLRSDTTTNKQFSKPFNAKFMSSHPEIDGITMYLPHTLAKKKENVVSNLKINE